LGELDLLVHTLNTIYCDNQSAIQVTDNPIVHNNMKHVELCAHYLRKLVHHNVFTLQYFITKDQVVYIFTKPLDEARFVNLRTLLRFQEATIMWGYHDDVISPPKSLEMCVDGGAWKTKH
jgi:hypothetical protein